MTGYIVWMILFGLAWGFAYWLGLHNGLAGVTRRAAWSRAGGMLLFSILAFGVQPAGSVGTSALVLPLCYLFGWYRMSRISLAKKAKDI